MLPVIAIVGRPNVGKSTLFNCLVKRRAALVADTPGVTRDRHYARAELDEQAVILIDTGGLADEDSMLEESITEQANLAIAESDLVIFVVDANAGVTASDELIVRQLRKSAKPVVLVVNKTDGHSDEVALEFHQLGIGEPLSIAAAHRRGINQLQTYLCERLAELGLMGAADAEPELEGISIAVVGRPNVGKSTLVNRILGEERVVVCDLPGTTMDSIFVPFERRGQRYTLIDTAGVRRKSKVTQAIEKFSIIKSLQAISSCDVCVYVCDASENIADQDLKLLGHVLDEGRSLVITVNKWDGLELEQRDQIKKELDRKLGFVDYARVHFISALHGTGVGDIFKSILEAYAAATRELSTPDLTRLLEEAVKRHQPPLVQGRRIKLRYAHAGGHKPPLIIIHGNQTTKVPAAYQRYLSNYFRQKLKLVGTPVRIEFKGGDNPYAGKKNKLTKRQQEKRKRLLKHHKK